MTELRALFTAVYDALATATQFDGLAHAHIRNALAEHVTVQLHHAGWTQTAGTEKGTPDFFQPGHIYSDAVFDWKFRVDTVTVHPENGERIALGWRYFKGQWEPIGYTEDDFDVQLAVGWTGVTEAGEGQ